VTPVIELENKYRTRKEMSVRTNSEFRRVMRGPWEFSLTYVRERTIYSASKKVKNKCCRVLLLNESVRMLLALYEYFLGRVHMVAGRTATGEMFVGGW